MCDQCEGFARVFFMRVSFSQDRSVRIFLDTSVVFFRAMKTNNSNRRRTFQNSVLYCGLNNGFFLNTSANSWDELRHARRQFHLESFYYAFSQKCLRYVARRSVLTLHACFHTSRPQQYALAISARALEFRGENQRTRMKLYTDSHFEGDHLLR